MKREFLMRITKYPQFGLLVLALLTITACTTSFTNESIDYKSQGEKKTPNLSVPPDLSMPNMDKRYGVSDGVATLSQYNSSATKGKEVVNKNTVTPEQAGFKIEREGNRRWIVAQKSSAELYPKIKSFWEDTGFLLATDSPNTGIMETDWAENRANIPDDMVRRFLGKNLETIYSTGERDKFRTRLEKSPKGETEIYISHKGAKEELTGADKNTTKWTAKPSDPELEAELLTRMLVYLGASNETAKTAVKTASDTSKARVARIQTIDQVDTLVIAQGFDRAWREVGLGLDRSNFSVEDRDRSKGIFYVRYVRSNLDPVKKEGWFSSLFSPSKEDELKKAKKYQVIVKSVDNSSTKVIVLDELGKATTSEVAKPILTILDQQVAI
jgi:outer membrane protein assembly factor BamC